MAALVGWLHRGPPHAGLEQDLDGQEELLPGVKVAALALGGRRGALGGVDSGWHGAGGSGSSGAGSSSGSIPGAAVAVDTGQQPQQPQQPQQQPAAAQPDPAALTAAALKRQRAVRSLSFPLCGGFAGQRIALLSGLVLAAELNRTAVLPRIVRGGAGGERSDTGGALFAGGDGTAPLAELYNETALIAAMAAAGVKVVTAQPVARPVDIHLDDLHDALGALGGPYASAPHIR